MRWFTINMLDFPYLRSTTFSFPFKKGRSIQQLLPLPEIYLSHVKPKPFQANTVANQQIKQVQSIRKIKLLACLILTLLTYSNAYNQKIVPPSPTAAGLGKYGDIPVSTYTGIPNISIPLYEIKEKNLNIPISLNYHASGIKIEEEASWVGLGWSLLAGGVITRSVRGLDDLAVLGSGEYQTGYPISPLPNAIDDNNDYIPQPGSTDWYYFASVCSKGVDSEPDIFYFNFAGHSGKFVFKPNQSPSDPYAVQLLSQEKMKISFDNGIWHVTTADGTKYIFGTTEKTKTYAGVVNPNSTSDPGDPDAKTVISSWYLDKIIAPDGEHIDFTYTAPSINGSRRAISVSDAWSNIRAVNVIAGSASCQSPSTQPNSHVYTGVLNVVYDVYLQKIEFTNGKMEFHTSVRDDLAPYIPYGSPPSLNTMPQKLDRIVLYKFTEGAMSHIKSYEFGYNYFKDPYASISQYSNFRLRLDTVIEKTLTSEKEPYLFDYITVGNSSQVPPKDSWGKDHWGFFNGNSNTNVPDPLTPAQYGKSLIPQYSFQLQSGQWVFYGGANREPDPAFAQTFTLKKVTYPTGGTSEFYFESNDYAVYEPVEVNQSTSLYAYGPVVQYPNPTTDPPSTIITITIPNTTVEIYGGVYQADDSYCLGNPNYSVFSARIQSTGTTPFFTQLVQVTIGCYGEMGFYKSVILQPGTYKVDAIANNNEESYVTVYWKAGTNYEWQNKVGGGIRVSKIVDHDGINHAKDIIRKFSYTKEIDGEQKSSGILMSKPVYNYSTQTQLYHEEVTSSGSCFVQYEVDYIHAASESCIPLGNSAQGSPIGYSEVTMSYGENAENGKTTYTYINIPETKSNLPFIPNTVHMENGFLQSETNYARNAEDNSFRKIKELRKTYKNETAQKKTIKGMKLFGCQFLGSNPAITPYYPLIKFYDTFSEWWHPESDTLRIYDSVDESKFSETVTTYLYANPEHLQLTQVTQTLSDGSKLIKEFRYPADYTSINSGVIAVMKDEDFYIHNAVIEETIKKQAGEVVKVIGSTFTVYDGFSFRPHKIYTLDIEGPKTDFVNSLPFGYPADNDYALKQTIEYDPLIPSLLKERRDENDFLVSYLWGYNNLYPIAEVKNARRDDIYYNSFEESGNSNIGDSKTGLKSMLNGYQVQLNISNGRYILSYWKKNTSQWEFQTATIDVTQGSYTINLSGQIDELRFYPTDAQMTTYTYDPLIGVTSQCDINNKIIYYVYDSFGRLKLIKDQNGEILKRYDYEYQQLVTQ